MDIRSIFILLGLLAASGALAEAYTWTDDDGVVHYSDRPNPGAVRIELPESPAPTRRTASRAASVPTSDEQQASEPAVTYQTLEIASPSAEQTLWNIGAVLEVTLTLSPWLMAGHRVRIYFDGTPQEVSSTRFQLQEVHRGAHNLQAEVVDETGQAIIRSQSIRFYVQQNSVL